MRTFLALLSILLVTVAAPGWAANVGFVTVKVPDPNGPALEVGIWYPTEAPQSDQTLGLASQVVAPDAPVAGRRLPLVVISHGSSGYFAEHYDTALALAAAGFVVAAPTHTGDNYKDMSRMMHLGDRPKQIKVVIDYMLQSWPQHEAINPKRIGVFGFSSGGFGALVAAGAVPDLRTLGPHCAAHPDFFDCQMTKRMSPPASGAAVAVSPAPAQPAVQPSTPASSAADWEHDPRIKAAVIAVPAMSFTFGREGLAKVRIPVQLWRAGSDQVLPQPYYAQAVRDELPKSPEYHVIDGADHNDFLTPCSPTLAKYVPGICTEIGGFDRAAFHVTFNREVVRFFRDSL